MEKRQEPLTDKHWELIEPLLGKPTGRPDSVGSAGRCGLAVSTGRVSLACPCWRRLQQWQEEGVWLDAWRALLRSLDEEGPLQWEEIFLDGSFAPAKKGG